MDTPARILVVDDDPQVRQVFALLLNDAGYDVLEASTGGEGLELAYAKRPDLALLDVLLPDINGTEICQRIKSDPDLRNTFIILISGGAINPGHKVQGLESGADDYMVKPFDPDELLARIRTIVRLKEAMSTLKASEEHHRRLIEILPDAVFLMRPDGALMAVNSQAAAMLGYSNHAELLARNAFDIVPAQQHERMRKDISDTLQKGIIRNAEYTVLRKAGEPMQVELSATTSQDGHGRSDRLLIVGRDVTERNKTKQRIQELLNLLDHASDAIVIRDLEGHIQYFNKGAERILGWTAEEVQGRHSVELLFEDPSEFTSANNVLRETGEWNSESHVLTKDHKPIVLQSRWTLVRSHPSRVISISTDITKRKESERLLIASQERFRQLAENIREVFWITDRAKSKMLYISPGYEEVWGRTCQSLYEDPATWVQTVHPEDRARIQEAVLTKQFSGQYDEIYRIVQPGGSLRWIHDRAFPVRNDAGEVYRIVGIAEDITAQKKAEEALREAESRYRSIFENATEGIFRTTPEGRILIANPALARILGYESPQEMVSAVKDIARQIYVSPQRRTEMKDRLLKQGLIQGAEEEIYRRDGSTIWIGLNAHVVRDANKQVEYLEGTIQDITNRKWADWLLQTQRDFGIFLSASIDLSATALRLLEISLQIEGVDCGGVFLLNSETGKMGLAASRGLSPDFVERVSNQVGESRSVRSDGIIVQHHDRLLADIARDIKRERLLAYEIYPIQHGGGIIALLCVGSHTTQTIPRRSGQAIELIAAQAGGTFARIKAEQSLRGSRRLLERTLESLPLAVLVVNADSMVIEECNPTAIRMFGYARGEMVGRTTSCLHVNQAAFEQFAAHLRNAIKNEGFLKDFEIEMKRKNGMVFPTEQSVTPIRNEAGRQVSRVNVIQDITERKRTEAELRQLPRRIIEAQESERLRVAREMHDGVNQVIASAKMRLHKIQNQEGINLAAREILDRCDKLLVRALEENRRIAYDLRPSDLDELGLAEACRNFCREVRARTDLAIACNITAGGRRLPAAVELNLFRIVQEALTNVEKHAYARSVRLRLSIRDDSVRLNIQDDGCGFAPSRAKAKRGKWRGIGLTNIRERALSLGGTCEVQSAPNRGTTVRIYVPCQQL